MRGNITILDRGGIERRACEYDGMSKKEFNRLLGERKLQKGRQNAAQAASKRRRRIEHS